MSLPLQLPKLPKSGPLDTTKTLLKWKKTSLITFMSAFLRWIVAKVCETKHLTFTWKKVPATSAIKPRKTPNLSNSSQVEVTQPNTLANGRISIDPASSASLRTLSTQIYTTLSLEPLTLCTTRQKRGILSRSILSLKEKTFYSLRLHQLEQ